MKRYDFSTKHFISQKPTIFCSLKSKKCIKISPLINKLLRLYQEQNIRNPKRANLLQ